MIPPIRTRARLRSSSDQLVSPEEYSLAGVNAQLALLTGTPSTPAGTPRGIRDDSSDTMSETDSQKSLRTRRKLPHLPPDQEAAPMPSHKRSSFGNAKDRVRSQMTRQSSLDGTSSGTRIGGSLAMARPSSSMTNLANISKDYSLPTRPGSALGYIGSSRGMNSINAGPQLKSGLPAGIAQCLPPDLHHLIYTNMPKTNNDLQSLYGSRLRDTAINSLQEDDLLASRLLGLGRSGRRNSESGLASDYWGRSGTPGGGQMWDTASLGSGRSKPTRKPRKPRSWHPSPYASDDDDDFMSREEKKQRIKVEISRRRQQIEENSRLHEELIRLARLRENAESVYADPSRTFGLGPYDQSPPQSARDPTTSVLRSIDDILRDARDPTSGYYSGYSSYKSNNSPYNPGFGTTGVGVRTSPRHNYGDSRGHSPSRYGHGLTEEDRSIARLASTFSNDQYGVPLNVNPALYDRLSDFSPLTSDLSDSMSDFTPAMPLLPDMPTRSRKLLEDLGSTPITGQTHRGKYDIQRRYRK